MESDVFLAASDVDARVLLIAAETDWTRPVPHCPAWEAADLVRHTGGIFEWMAAIVSSTDRVSRRTLDPAPDHLSDLASWYLGALDRTIEVLGSADPASETWTFSTTGDHRVGWWCRRLAVEVAIHRWDIDHAVVGVSGPRPKPLDGAVAAAGVEEFVVEFLPGLVAQEGIEGVGGTLQLHATDAPVEWWLDLDSSGRPLPGHSQADTTVYGTRSDLLLWLTNRGPLDSLEVSGKLEITSRWHQLRR
jgi:uncharacterized protein (TIGR03083 family)